MARMEFRGNTVSSPDWIGDELDPEDIARFPAKLLASAFSAKTGIKVVVAVAGAAANATSIPVAALAYPDIAVTVGIAQGNTLIPAGTTLRFGTKKFATLTVDAILGDTALTVEALPTALVSTDTAYYAVPGGEVFVPSGTLVGRTFTERSAGTPFGPADTATPDDEIFLTVFDSNNLNLDNNIELLRANAGLTVKENYLPDWATMSGADKTVLRARYQTIVGKD